MNLSGFIDDDSASSQLLDLNLSQPLQSQQNELDAIGMFNYFMTFASLALGGSGNLLSAIVWLRRHVTGKNSSALYLAVLAINDLAYLIINAMFHAALM